MRFEKSRTPPPYLNSRDQWRLLGLVAMLLFVLVAIRIAARPETWAWMFPNELPSAEHASGEQPSVSEIDHGVQLDAPEHLPPDGFRSPAGKDAENPESRTEFAEEATTEDGVTSQEHGSPAANPAVFAPDGDLLAAVADNTLGIRRTEAPAYYALLARAREVPPRELDAAARSGVSYPLLMMDAERFRGKLLSIAGELKRLQPIKPGENDAGIERLYDAWIITPDSGSNLYRVVCTEIADGLPQGSEIRRSIPVRVTGFFFKKEGYAARHGLHTAPVLLAQRIDRLPAPAGIGSTDGLGPYLIGIAIVVAAAVGATLWYYSASDRRARDIQRQRMTRNPDDSNDPINSLQTEDPVQFLRELAVPTPATTETPSTDPVADSARSASANVKTDGDADN